MSDLCIRPVSSEADLQAFLRTPWEVYKDDPNWCPPLWTEHVHFFDPEHNAELRHIDLEKFVAWRDDKPVGTIIAFVNHAYNDFQKQNAGWFGQFEILEDREAAHALLKTAEDWVRAKGVDKLIGPATFSTNSEIGLLVEGSEYPQMLMTSHARPYVKGLVESYGGFKTAMDIWCWHADGEIWGGIKANKIPEKIARVAEKIKKRRNFTVRTANMSRFHEEVERVKEIYNKAWKENWAFIPFNQEEADQLEASMKDMIDGDIIVFVELNGKPIGVGVPLPNLYEPLRKAHCKPGEPNWWQLAKLIWHWKIAGKVTSLRVWALGVLEEYRGQGVDALIYYEMLKQGLSRGYLNIEMGWILSTNDAMNAVPKAYGGKVYKVYRVYEKMIARA